MVLKLNIHTLLIKLDFFKLMICLSIKPIFQDNNDLIIYNIMYIEKYIAINK